MEAMSDKTLVTLVELFGIEFTEQEMELLTSPALRGLDKQRAFVLRMALQVCECPACKGKICQRSACPDWTPDGHVPDDGYRCPICETPLTWHLGLLGGEQWFTTTTPLVKAVRS